LGLLDEFFDLFVIPMSMTQFELHHSFNNATQTRDNV